MTLKWESNSRVKALIGKGIEPEDIIPRGKTEDFPVESATVRIHRVREQNPYIVIHFRGVGQARSYKYWDYQNNTQKIHTYTGANTTRIGFRVGQDEYSVNGDLDSYILPELDGVVKRVKGILENV